jgi:CRISPR-associated endonuclease Cas1
MSAHTAAPARTLRTRRKTAPTAHGGTSTLVPTDGVLALNGYGIRIAIERGHLIVEDGIGINRRRGRFHRIERLLRRLIVIGHTGAITFEAIRWLADARVAFLQVDSDGRLLAVAGPDSPDHPALRRAQAAATNAEVGMTIMRSLLCQKLSGQQEILRGLMTGQLAIPQIEMARRSLDRTPDFVALRAQESKAAAAYWASWQDIPVHFAKHDAMRVPSHWRTFGSRTSALTSSPRLAANPANAMLNYLYAILEAEARIALLTVGLDPGVGIQHADQRSRDSMACDVMEAVRPAVDRYLLDLLNRQIFQRTEFFETREGGCRLMPGIAADLSHTAGRWARCLGPVVEDVAQTLYRAATEPATRHRWISRRGAAEKAMKQTPPLPTPLTETNRKKARHRLHGGCQAAAEGEAGLSGGAVEGVLDKDGAPIQSAASRRSLTTPNVEESTRRLLTSVLVGVEPLGRDVFLRAIIPALRGIPAYRIAEGVGLSVHYCAKIRAGRCVPSEVHWEVFRRLLNDNRTAWYT